MNCPQCQGPNYTYRTQQFETVIRRWRKCKECGHSFTTHEVEVSLERGRPPGSESKESDAMDLDALAEIRAKKVRDQ